MALEVLRSVITGAGMDDCDCDECECASVRPYSSCAIFTAIVSIVLFALSWDTIEPTEFGIVKNGFTGYVELDPESVYTSGRYFIWIRHNFIKFPRNLVNLEFSDAYGGHADRGVIAARTGPDPDDKESGGQPIKLSVSFQYKMVRKNVPLVYQTFGAAYEASFLLFAQQAITNEAQLFTPRTFWTNRGYIEKKMHEAVNKTLFEQGYSIVHSLQLLKVDFSNNYEDIITQIQLQEQLKVTKGYALNVTRVLKEVDVMQSRTAAQIAQISASADREANVIINSANAAAIKTEQEAKVLSPSPRCFLTLKL